MANIIDKFLNSMKLNDEADEFDEEDDEYLDEPVQDKKKSGFFSRKSSQQDDEDEEPAAPVRDKAPRGRAGSNVVPMRNQHSMEVYMLKPGTFEEAREVCDILLSGRAVVINMEGIDVDTAQRIMDFTSGACYSQQGKLKRISTRIFMVSPTNIDLSGEFQGMLDNADNNDHSALSL